MTQRAGILGRTEGSSDLREWLVRAFRRNTRVWRPLLGRDPLATELVYDQMIRLNRHGRSGLFMTGVSPVDCALWDLKGKLKENVRHPDYRGGHRCEEDSDPFIRSPCGAVHDIRKV